MENQNAQKKVWLIGAGASISDSNNHFPSLLELPQRARDLGLLDPAKNTGGEVQQLRAYLRRKFYGDITQSGNSVDLESVLTLLEIDIAVDPDPKLLMIRKFILTLLRRTIATLHQSSFRSNNEYARLALLLSPTDSVISFNWDLLLDNAFGRETRLEIPVGNDCPRLYDDDNLYGRFLLDLSGWGARTVKHLGFKPPTTVPDASGMYIKAHGSIDWYYCADADCPAYGFVYPMLRQTKKPTCPGCLARTSTLLVPPTLNKRLRDLPFLRKLWQLAAREVRQATEIVSWGYSMPPTDFFSEWLLRHARASRCRRLTIINPAAIRFDGERGHLETNFVDRFVGALRLPGKPIRLTVYESFADFESKQHVGIKYPETKPELRKAARRSPNVPI